MADRKGEQQQNGKSSLIQNAIRLSGMILE